MEDELIHELWNVSEDDSLGLAGLFSGNYELRIPVERPTPTHFAFFLNRARIEASRRRDD